MAYTSFVLKKSTIEGGSSLRRTSYVDGSETIAVYDSGLRADGYFPPIPQEYLQSTFNVECISRTEIYLSWELGTALVSTLTPSPEPAELIIRASEYGEPVTVADGEHVIKVTADAYREDFLDQSTVYIREGNWVYYSLFIGYLDDTSKGYYERVATLSVQVPRNFDSFNDLWNRIPAYYKSLDETVSLDQDKNTQPNPLRRFVELFAWELDKVRTTIYDTMRINDPAVVHSSAINALANQAGLDLTKESLGTAKLRAVLDNIGQLQRTKGTVESIEGYISALSGCGVTTDTTVKPIEFNVHPMRVNLFDDPFFSLENDAPAGPDTGISQGVWTDLSDGDGDYGWSVSAKFATGATVTSSMTVSNSGGKLTITLPAVSNSDAGLREVHLAITSLRAFPYNNDLTYFYSAKSSHPFVARFFESYSSGAGTFPPPFYEQVFMDSWNDALDISDFPTYQDSVTGERQIVETIPFDGVGYTGNQVCPVFFITLTASQATTTTVTFEKPLVEYKNSRGKFFSGDEPLGGFLPTAANSSPGVGIYDYHWGPNNTGFAGEDFSFYTSDFKRSKDVVVDTIKNYIAPVTLVYGTDYVINWDVLE